MDILRLHIVTCGDGLVGCFAGSWLEVSGRQFHGNACFWWVKMTSEFGGDTSPGKSISWKHEVLLTDVDQGWSLTRIRPLVCTFGYVLFPGCPCRDL